MVMKNQENKKIKEIAEKIADVKKEMSKLIVGQEQIINGLIKALICDGHVLLEGVPGIAKTLVIRALGKVSGCDVKRVQFTVDLLPTDIVGLTIYSGKGFEVVKGPVFANFLIADEINRSPPKTQSALLESMQERQVTIGKETFSLPKPFFVMATENPIEHAGVYSLPEAQVDRFLFKLNMNYPDKLQEKKVLRQNIDTKRFDEFNLKKVISPKDIIEMQEMLDNIYVSSEIENYIVDMVNATRDKKGKYHSYIEWGSSPRASIYLFKASRAEAMMAGRSFVVPQDVKNVAFDVLRHRILLNYEAEAENITPDKIINEIINEIPVP